VFPGEWLAPCLITGLAIFLAATGVRFHAGSWNDGSRLAAVESLLSRGTLAIDDSMFVNTALAPSGHSPYDPADANLKAAGTLDKLLINGHYHSDKPPVVSLVLAALYRPFEWVGLAPAPGKNPEVFIWLLTQMTSVAAFAASLVCLHLLGRQLGLPWKTHALWLGSFALGTFALAYTRQVNAHILQLAVASFWCLATVRMASGDLHQPVRVTWAALLGCALGFGYNLDLGSGPLMLVCGLALLAVRRQAVPLMAACLAAAPWVVACHWINLSIGGVAGPLNAVPEHLAWPGSPFSSGNMTGVMRHSFGGFLLYAGSLLGGKHGVLVHNLPLLLCLPALATMARSKWNLELLACLGWCGAAWGLYSLMSNNHSGGSCSVRWFVPFLAPGFFLLGAYLSTNPGKVADLAVLGAWGTVLGLTMWQTGPWTTRMIPGLWPVVGCALVSWLALAIWRLRRRRLVECLGGLPALINVGNGGSGRKQPPQPEGVEPPQMPQVIQLFPQVQLAGSVKAVGEMNGHLRHPCAPALDQ